MIKSANIHNNLWSLLHSKLPYPCFSGSEAILDIRSWCPTFVHQKPPTKPAVLLHYICVTQHLHDDEFLTLGSIPKSSEVMWQI